MPNFENHVEFDPEKDIPSLAGKVILVTGGTAGIGRETVTSLARHQPQHMYFTGRDIEAAEQVAHDIREIDAAVTTTFIKMDMNSLLSVKSACQDFVHDRLDILICNAGAHPPAGLSIDGYESHFAICHLAHAMIIRQLLPIMTRTAAKIPGADVRVVIVSSAGWISHPPDGITFGTLRTPQKAFMGGVTRYAQAKLTNLIYASSLAHHVPPSASTSIDMSSAEGNRSTADINDGHSLNSNKSGMIFVSVHPGAVLTAMTASAGWLERVFLRIFLWFRGASLMNVNQGALSQLWAAAGASRQELVNGGYYMPIGRYSSDDRLDEIARSSKLRDELWTYTESVLDGF